MANKTSPFKRRTVVSRVPLAFDLLVVDIQKKFDDRGIRLDKTDVMGLMTKRIREEGILEHFDTIFKRKKKRKIMQELDPLNFGGFKI